MRAVIFAILVLAACSPRADLVRGGVSGAPEEQIYVGSTRAPEGDGFGARRSEIMTLARFDVAIPPTHQPGALSVPTAKKSNPQTDFMVARSQIYPTDAAFRASLARTLAASHGEAVVFVHGYNNNFAEGLYRFAQMGADLDRKSVV